MYGKAMATLCPWMFMLTAALSALATSSSLPGPCCARLDAALPGRVSYEGSARYEFLNSHRWSQTAALYPQCVVEASSADDVSAAIRILGAPSGDVSLDCKFAVKSGGHMAHPGANDISGGVSLDLSRLNHRSVTPDQRLVRLGAGGTWQKAYDMFPDLLFTGGVCGETGIGGVALGGGMSLLLANDGWVANNIENYELVVANGSIINANATHHSDLYLALKGGGANFGVVTAVSITTLNIHGKIYGGQILSPATPSVTTEVLQSLVRFTSHNNDDTLAGLQIVFVYDKTGAAMVDNLIAHVDGANMSPMFDSFLGLKPQIYNTLGWKTMGSIAREASAVQPSGYRDLTATFTFDNDLTTLEEIHIATVELHESIKDVPDMDVIFSYVPLPSVVAHKSAQRGGDVMGLERELKDRISMFFSPRWLDAQYDKEMYRAARTWYSKVSTIARRLGTDDEFLYHNFAGDFQDPLGSYGAKNVELMRSVSHRYDPGGLFQSRMPGGFKLANTLGQKPGLYSQTERTHVDLR